MKRQANRGYFYLPPKGAIEIIIYEAINQINGKRYIGQTRNGLKHRKRQHFNASKHAQNVSWHFYRAINKYGWDHFEWKIIDYANTQEDLDVKESFWIEFFNTTDPEKGYNLKGGGYNPFLTEDVKRKIGDAQLGQLNHSYGKVGEDNSSSRRFIDLTTGEVYIGVSDFCRTHPEFSLSKVCAACRGDRVTTHGHIFRYLDENNDIIDNGIELTSQTVLKNNLGEIFPRVSYAFHKYLKEKQDKSAFYAKLNRNPQGCEWNGLSWHYEEIDFSKYITK